MKNLMILSYDVTNPTNLNILEKTIKSRLSYLADTFSSVNNSIFFFLPVILFIFSNVGWVPLEDLGLKITWQILISSSGGKEDGYSTNHYVQFMEEVKVI